MKRFFRCMSLCFIMLCIPVVAFCQPPATDLYLMGMTIEEGKIQLGEAVNITDRDGYDNQPAFLPDGSAILFSSIRGEQTDVYKYTLADKAITQVTDTPESEYSPTPMLDKEHFSTVRVEMDETQRLWKFTLDGQNPTLVLEEVKRIGYHGWGNDHTLGLFVLGEAETDPFTFQMADTNTGKAEVILENPGRSFHKIPGENALSFIHKVSETEWWVKKIDLETREVSEIIKTPEGSEDSAWTPDGILLMPKDSKVYKFKPGTDEDWQEVADLADAGAIVISRVAVNPAGDKLVVVSSRKPAE